MAAHHAEPQQPVRDTTAAIELQDVIDQLNHGAQHAAPISPVHLKRLQEIHDALVPPVKAPAA